MDQHQPNNNMASSRTKIYGSGITLNQYYAQLQGPILEVLQLLMLYHYFGGNWRVPSSRGPTSLSLFLPAR